MPHSWSEHVANAESFAAENFLIGVGGLIAEIQLFNPVGSGVRVRLRSVHAISAAAQNVNVRRHDVALATLGLPAGFIVENLLGSGAAEVAEMRSASPVVLDGTLIWSAGACPSQPAIFPPQGNEWGFDLLEGQGLIIQAATGLTVIVNWHWVEVPL